MLTQAGGRPEITEDQKQEIREAFTLFDIDKTGKLAGRELSVAMRALGFPTKKEDIRKYIEEHQKDGNAKIELADFMEISTFFKRRRKREERVPNREAMVSYQCRTRKRRKSAAIAFVRRKTVGSILW